MFTSLRFLCFGNTPLPSLNSSRSTPSIEVSRISSLSPIEEEPATPSTPKLNSNGLTLSSGIGSYPIPSSLMREVESIRTHILQQKIRHQNQQSRRHKQKNRRQKLQEPTITPSTKPPIRQGPKPTPTSYNDVSSPYADDTSVFELNLAGENDTSEKEPSVSIQHDWDEMVNPHYNYITPEEQTWGIETDAAAYWGLDDLISQGYFETYDSSLLVGNPPANNNFSDTYSMSRELVTDQAPKNSNGNTGWWLVKHVDPKALSKLGSDCVIL
ncbi:hypothetical protein TWF718_004216 [Orbilia javanica]|uniref:Uncharacterized protein n=1 Tax=Orbilia javanica TaxID=47235 RepID=A0AAN8RQ55_9PEZI